MPREDTMEIDMPITYEVNQALTRGKSAKEAVTDLLGRSQKADGI
jgi:glycerol-3-phosphate dehydrogenase (NAD(P)+)